MKHINIKVLVKQYKNGTDGYKGARIQKGYNYYLTVMIDKHLEQRQTLKGRIIVILTVMMVQSIH